MFHSRCTRQHDLAKARVVVTSKTFVYCVTSTNFCLAELILHGVYHSVLILVGAGNK